MADTLSKPLFVSPQIFSERPQSHEQDSPRIEGLQEGSSHLINPNPLAHHKKFRQDGGRRTATFPHTLNDRPNLLSPQPSSQKISSGTSGPLNGNGVFTQYLQDISQHPVLKADDQLSLALLIARARRHRDKVLSFTPLALRHLLDLLNRTADQGLPWSSLMDESRTKNQIHPGEDPVTESDSPSSWLIVERLRQMIPEFLRLQEKCHRGWASPGRQPVLKRRLIDSRREIFQQLEMIVFHPNVYDSIIDSLETTEQLLHHLTGDMQEWRDSSVTNGSHSTIDHRNASHPSVDTRLPPHPSESISHALLGILEQDVLYMKAKSFLKALDRLRRISHTIEEKRNHLILGNLRLVISIALSFRNFHIPLPDLIQEGNLALMKAVDRFDCHRGIKLSSYATWWIWKAIGRMIRGRGHLIHLPDHMMLETRRMTKLREDLSQSLGRLPSPEELTRHTGYSLERIELLLELPMHELSLDTLCSENTHDQFPESQFSTQSHLSPLAQAYSSELKKLISANLKLLPADEAHVLCKRFGLEGHEEQSLSEIAKSQGMSKEQIRQIEMRGLRRFSECETFRELGDLGHRVHSGGR
jgi:RNA polymerase sigma factor (sigma-70 family)